MTVQEQLQQRCQSIADDIEKPPEVKKEDSDRYPNAEVGEPLTSYDYLEDAFDTEFVCCPSSTGLAYRSGSILLAMGGPNIEAKTNAFNNFVLITGVWGSNEVEITVPDNMGIDDYLEDQFNLYNNT